MKKYHYKMERIVNQSGWRGNWNVVCGVGSAGRRRRELGARARRRARGRTGERARARGAGRGAASQLLHSAAARRPHRSRPGRSLRRAGTERASDRAPHATSTRSARRSHAVARRQPHAQAPKVHTPCISSRAHNKNSNRQCCRL